MFTGSCASSARSSRPRRRAAGARSSSARPETAARHDRWRLGRGQRLLPHGGGITGADIAFHAVPETIARTTLGVLQLRARVNVEPALRAGDELGGHYVQGHVDAVGRIQSVEAEGEGLRVFVEAPDDVLRYCVEKGSITVDGVSLTVAELAQDAFAVALVPHTLAVDDAVRASSRGRT